MKTQAGEETVMLTDSVTSRQDYYYFPQPCFPNKIIWTKWMNSSESRGSWPSQDTVMRLVLKKADRKEPQFPTQTICRLSSVSPSKMQAA